MTALEEKLSERYDRQIRLWGADAQQNISKSRALMCGLGAVNAEVCKNLVLAGISATLQDDATVTAKDLSANFFLTMDDVGKNRAAASLDRVRELNQFVSVESCEEGLTTLSDEFILKHNIVCMAGCGLTDQVRINQLCRANKIAFFSADTFGHSGGFFVDLGAEFSFQREMGTGENQQLSAPQTMRFCSLDAALATRWSELTNRFGLVSPVYVCGQLLAEYQKRFGSRPNPASEEDAAALATLCRDELARNGMPADYLAPSDLRHLAEVSSAEFAPTCAVIGGVLGQEVIKSVSRKGEPFNNVFIFDGVAGAGKLISAAPSCA